MINFSGSVSNVENNTLFQKMPVMIWKRVGALLVNGHV
jgi:hypothetical protein